MCLYHTNVSVPAIQMYLYHASVSVPVIHLCMAGTETVPIICIMQVIHYLPYIHYMYGGY